MMKWNLCLLIIVTAGLISCSSDKEAMETASNSILGSWNLTALQFDESTATDDMEMGQDLLNFLTAINCHIVTLTFNEDFSFISENSVNYIQINVNSNSSGLDVPCPTEKDTDESIYTYENGILTFVDDNQETVSVDAVITGNLMVISAQELGVDNFDAGGDLVFTRK